MKHILLAKLIKRLIQDEAREYFNQKLSEFDDDLNALLSSPEAIEDLNNYLQIKEEVAVVYIMEKYEIDINQFNFYTKDLIFKEVEHKIFYK